MVYLFLAFIGLPAILWIYIQVAKDQPYLLGPILVFLAYAAYVIALPVLLLVAGIYAAFAFIRRGIKPPAADDSGAVLSSDVDNGRGR